MYTKEQLLQILASLDLTSLEATDHEESLKVLVQKANFLVDSTHVAAVCVYPNLGSLVKSSLAPAIKTAVVAGYFPSGQTFTETKLAELRQVESSLVDEVDIVINRGEFLAGNYRFVQNELEQMRAAVPTKKLKVILETGELKTGENIKRASEIAIQAGADFIKTSTGKSTTGATPDAVEVMCQVIRKHADQTGKKIGIKPSGGVRTIEQAITYLNLVEQINGTEWIQPDLFRIGASALYDAVISELQHERFI